ncbi:MAG: helix-turn-helix domain-containing protein [Halohasta sp.]
MSSRVALHTLLTGLLVVLLAISGIAGSVAGQQSTPELVVEQHGSGVALENESETYLWQYSSYAVTVTFTADSTETHTVCLSEADDGSVEEPLGCQWTAVDEDGPTSVTLTQSEWPENITGEETLAVDIYSGRTTSGEPTDRALLPVYIIEKDGDLAGNGLTNEREIELGTHPARADTDGDGITDGIEVMLGTGPRDPATPYWIAALTIGSLAVGVVGLMLVAGRVVMALEALGIRSRHDADDEPVDSTAERSFEPPIRDEERVRRLLSAHDGRLKQSQIVEATEWSKSKVSRLLSSMEDDDRITRIRLGRENLVCLRGHEPPDISPSWTESDDDGDESE